MIATTRNKAARFTAMLWIRGAANFTDADPNVTPPAANRTLRIPSGPFLSQTAVSTWLADGTSATIRNWFYDDGQAIWVPFLQGLALTYAGTNLISASYGAIPGAKVFVQVVANVGVTKIAMTVR